jgi:glycosyltransferase involved in cell wall biosynthesis
MSEKDQQVEGLIVFVDDAHTLGGAQIAMALAIDTLLRHTRERIICVCTANTRRTVERITGQSVRLEFILAPAALPLNVFAFPFRLKPFLSIIRRLRRKGVRAWWVNLSGIEFCLAPMLILKALGQTPRGWLHNGERFAVFNKDASWKRRTVSRVRDWIADKYLFGLYPLLITPSHSSEVNIQIRMSKTARTKTGFLYPVPKKSSDFACDSDAVSDRTMAEPVKLWMIGRVDYAHKNNLKALDVLELLISQGRMAFLTLAGDGPDLEDFKSRAVKRGLADKISYAGWSNDPWKMTPSDAIVFMPSLTEGMPLVATEAMLNGIRLVVSPIPPFFEGSPAQMIAADFTADSFAKKILEVHALRTEEVCRLYADALVKFSDKVFVEKFLAYCKVRQ